MHNTDRIIYFAAIALLAAGLSGCTQSQPAAPTATSPSAPQQASTPAAQPAASAQVATPVFPPPAAPNTVLTTDGDLSGTKITINELKRGPNTVTLRFTMYNDSATELSVGSAFNDPKNYGGFRNVSAVHLIDAASKKKYFVVADSDGTCVCSENVHDVAPKSQVSLWAKFPAPPDDVQKITVEVPHFIPVEDVPISK